MHVYRIQVILPQVWKSRTLVREAFGIHNMPVKDVEFVHFHQIQRLKDTVHG